MNPKGYKKGGIASYFRPKETPAAPTVLTVEEHLQAACYAAASSIGWSRTALHERVLDVIPTHRLHDDGSEDNPREIFMDLLEAEYTVEGAFGAFGKALGDAPEEEIVIIDEPSSSKKSKKRKIRVKRTVGTFEFLANILKSSLRLGLQNTPTENETAMQAENGIIYQNLDVYESSRL